MTRDELKEHCCKVVSNRTGMSTPRMIEEHEIILDMIEEHELLGKTLLMLGKKKNGEDTSLLVQELIESIDELEKS